MALTFICILANLFFGCVQGIQNSVIYNTIIETCKQVEVSFRDYFCGMLRDLKKGRTDYEYLLSITMQIIIIKFLDSFLDEGLFAFV